MGALAAWFSSESVGRMSEEKTTRRTPASTAAAMNCRPTSVSFSSATGLM